MLKGRLKTFFHHQLLVYISKPFGIVMSCSSDFAHKWRKTCQNVLALLKLLMSISEEAEDETSNYLFHNVAKTFLMNKKCFSMVISYSPTFE